MELADYVRALRRGWITICVFVLSGILGGALLSLMATPVYSSQTQLFVAIQSSGNISELQQGNSFSQARVQSYVKTARTPIVLQPVIDDLSLNTTPSQLADKVAATADSNTVLITLTAVDDSPAQASAIAQSVAQNLVEAVEVLEGDSRVKLSVVTPASVPTAPSSPNNSTYLGVGVIAGLALGLLTVFMWSVRDSKVRGEVELRRVSDIPLLGALYFDSDAVKKPLLTQSPGQSPRAESFRQVRTNLQFTNVSQNQQKSVLVTSSVPGEGKTTTATNMAIALAQSGQRVALVDADLRRPMVASYLGLEGGAGLTTALIGAAELPDLLQPWGEDELFVLTSGQIPPNPSELLGSEGMTRIISHLESDFDVVIIDAPPLIPVTDATVLSQKVGGVVLVVGAAKVRTQDLEKSLSSLELVDAQVLGVVLNLLPSKGPDAYAYAYHSYESKPDAARKYAPAKVFNGSHMRSARRSRNTDTDFDALVSKSSS